MGTVPDVGDGTELQGVSWPQGTLCSINHSLSVARLRRTQSEDAMSLTHSHRHHHESLTSGVLARMGEALSRTSEDMDDRSRARTYMHAQRDGAKRAQATIATGNLRDMAPKRTIKLDR